MHKLNVTVVHADLRMASYPLMLGHLKEDGIINAEKTLNNRLKNELEEIFNLGDYPTNIGMNKVILDHTLNPKGAIIVGLGESRFLGAYNLSKSVAAAVKKYVYKIQRSQNVDHLKYINSISSLCIGSGYGNLSMTESLSAIVTGITMANDDLIKMHPAKPIIENLEIVENVNFVASKAYATLFKLARTNSDIILQKDIIKRYGRNQNISHEEHKRRWHVFTTELLREEKGSFDLKMRLNSGSARIEENTIPFENLADNHLLQGIKLRNYWESSESKALYERLIPKPFKQVLSSRLDVVWQIDKYAAGIPWELIHANSPDEVPTFVNTGLIRQLISTDYDENPKILRTNNALVIGKPFYEDNERFSPLFGSEIEANEIVKMLKNEDFNVVVKTNGTGENNYNALINKEYKVLHVAAHGKYSSEGGEVGIALGGGKYFGPQDFKNKTYIPEFAFINCCYSGTIDHKDEEFSQEQYQIAANIGTQLIDMGSEAVIVAGWTVKDKAAREFATVLYEELLEGYTFGEATKKAREQCYYKDKTSTTWAAFQCYGTPGYRLIKKAPKAVIHDEYILIEDVLIDLNNLFSSTEDNSALDHIKKLDAYIAKAKKSNFRTSQVIEMQAKIYQACGLMEEALATYKELLEKEDAQFSVRSLEQYSNLFAKVLYKRYKEDPSSVTVEDKNLLSDQLKYLSVIGVTSERISLQGSGFKRLAKLESDDTTALLYIEQMHDAYKEAYRTFILKSNNIKKSIYPLSNWLTGAALIPYNETQRKKYLNILTESEEKLALETIKGEVFWDDISMVNVLMCQLLFVKPSDDNYQQKLENLKTAILANYEEHWDVAGNAMHLQGEMEHLEFLIRFVAEEGVNKALVEILRELGERCGKTN